ncbi:methylmalonyl-CoA mutase subunit beta [Neobacillus sp. K501]
MSLDELKSQSFASVTTKDWVEKAEATLKGKTIESLKSYTYENIILKPLYSRADEQKPADFPAGGDFRRGIYPLGYITNNWKIAQQVSFQTPLELKDKLFEVIEKGQTALSFDITSELIEANDTLRELIKGLSERYPFAVNAKGLLPNLLTEVRNIAEKTGKSDKITGYISSDPISLFAEEGVIVNDALSDWANTIKTAHQSLPNVRTVLINASSYHQGGANAVQELAIAAATGVYYLQHLSELGMPLKDVLAKMIFKFSIGSNFFMEVAKLRAARILWNKITKSYGASVEFRGMHIAAETSSYTKTVYDPHVNILRAGNEAFAAVIGGIQYLHVSPFNEITGSTQLGERIARNTQSILQEEVHLQKIVDPAGGSWYIESLTSELAEKAWKFFQQIEANGGIMEALASNWLQNEIGAISEKRAEDIATRKQSIVGTNVYANLDEVVTCGNEIESNNYLNYDESDVKIKAILKSRLSEPYESLRKQSEMIESKSGFKPQVGLVCLGELKQYKPRLDFMRGFFSAGGLQVADSDSIVSYEDAKQFVSNLDSKYFCFCGTNEQYEMIGHAILGSLQAEFEDRFFYLAGLPEKELQPAWKNEGIKQFIHVKSNCYETLSSILTEMEVTVNEVTKA